MKNKVELGRIPIWAGMLLFMVLLNACGSGKMVVTEEQRAAVQEMVTDSGFEFTGQWAMPMSTGDMSTLMNAGLLAPGDSPNRINLMGNPNFLKIRKDSVSAYLPFFGRQQFNVSLNPRDQAIQFDQIANDLVVNFDEKKDTYEIRFSASEGNQGYVVFLTVFPNATASLRINSSARDNIGYQGAIKPLMTLEEKRE